MILSALANFCVGLVLLAIMNAEQRKIKHGKIQNLSFAVGLSLLAIMNAEQRFLLVLDLEVGGLERI